jgi:hypothetical protein
MYGTRCPVAYLPSSTRGLSDARHCQPHKASTSEKPEPQPLLSLPVTPAPSGAPQPLRAPLSAAPCARILPRWLLQQQLRIVRTIVRPHHNWPLLTKTSDHNFHGPLDDCIAVPTEHSDILASLAILKLYCECLGTTWTGNPARDPVVFFRTVDMADTRKWQRSPGEFDKSQARAYSFAPPDHSTSRDSDRSSGLGPVHGRRGPP